MATFIMSWVVTIPGESGAELEEAQQRSIAFASACTDVVEAVATQQNSEFPDVGAFGGTIAMTSSTTISHSVW